MRVSKLRNERKIFNGGQDIPPLGKMAVREIGPLSEKTKED